MTEKQQEIKRLLILIDPWSLSDKDFKIVRSTSNKIESGAEVSDDLLFYLRDLKDRQLDSK